MSNKRSIYFALRRAVKRTLIFLLALSFILIGGMPNAGAEGSILYVKPVEPETGDCSSWVSACDLQTALNQAVSGNQIWLAAGIYTPGPVGSIPTVTFQLKDGVAVYGGFNGNETLLSQRNWTMNVVILSGDLNGDDSGFTNNDENSLHVVTGAIGASLDGVTIRGGNAYGSSYLEIGGGGMFNPNGTNPTLTNVTFSGNEGIYGGGMYNTSGSNPTLTNVTFIGNVASLGGGMHNEVSTPMLSNVTFINNRGGGMSNKDTNAILNNVIFDDNDGGGMLNFFSSPMLTNVTFTGNSAQNGGGMNNSYSNPVLNNVIFRDNTASSWGGGMYNASDSRPMLSNVTFSGNTAQNGGVLYNSNSSPTLNYVTFSNNTAYNFGGGMYNTDNSSPTLSNSILWGDSGSEIYNHNSSITTISYSDVQSGYAGTGNMNTDPRLATLGNYGGGVETIAILPGSPVIDATSSNCPATDGRGRARSSPNCDLGAFESQGFTQSKKGGDGQTTLVNTAFIHPLCVTVTAKDAGDPVDGGKVTFIPPSSGAAATLAGSPVTIAGGEACANAVANGIPGGPYDITASASGAANVTFRLTNEPVRIYLPMIRK